MIYVRKGQPFLSRVRFPCFAILTGVADICHVPFSQAAVRIAMQVLLHPAALSKLAMYVLDLGEYG